VTIVFYLVAAAMLAVALALLLVPLVRHGRREGRSRGVFAVAVAIALLVPVASVGTYLLVGQPATLGGVAPAAEMTIDQGIAALRAQVKTHPDDVKAWLLLGQAFTVLKQPADARAAYDGALRAEPRNVEAMVGWAEADSLARDDHRIEGRSRELLDAAVGIDPTSQKALWLLGISDFQQQRYAEASATWKKLQPLLDPDSNVARAVAKQIALADERAAQPHPN
jgi:cytochrome c-type biogenesis protein CcmH